MPTIDPFSILTMLVIGASIAWLAYHNWKAVKDPASVADVSSRIAMLLLAGLTGAIAGAAFWAFTATQDQQAASATTALTNVVLGSAASLLATSATIITMRYIRE